jgi:hypothetical protein
MNRRSIHLMAGLLLVACAALARGSTPVGTAPTPTTHWRLGPSRG